MAALAIPEDSTNLPLFSFSGGEWPKGTAPLEEPMLYEIQKWMDKNQKAFDAVTVEQLRGSWIGCSFSNGFTNLVYAPVSKINSLTKLLCLNAVLQAEVQHPKEAIQSLEKAAAVGNSWRNDMPIHGLIRLSTQDRVCRTLERVFNRTIIADLDLMSVSDSLTSTNLGATKEFMASERCLGLFHANQLQSLAKQTTSYTFSPVRRLLKSYEARIIYRDQDLLNFLVGNAGSLPDSLAELAPGFLTAVPIDPFDEQPLRYKKLARGYVIYSIGPDFTDDGGKEKPADAKESDHYDITFTVER